jgi:putative addiction module component (TIGR02574 family)
MGGAAKRILDDVLALPEQERLEIASEIIASVDGPADADWDAVWLAELERRAKAAEARGTPAPEWAEVRARILARLASR